MNRYVKTKDTIFELEAIYSNPFEEKTYCVSRKGERPCTIEGIIKTADTIEELIDRYILNTIDIIILNTNHTQYRFEHSDEWFDITDTELRYGIYGAIWVTCKGLIYVSKMNDKGDLELI